MTIIGKQLNQDTLPSFSDISDSFDKREREHEESQEKLKKVTNIKRGDTTMTKQQNQDTLSSILDTYGSVLDNIPEIAAFRSFYAKSISKSISNMELEENDSFYFLRAELPGMTKEDLSISFENHWLSVSGEKKEPTREENSRLLFSEIHYGKFSRPFKLSGNIHADKINAEFKDGILLVSIPKAEQAKPSKIEIK